MSLEIVPKTKVEVLKKILSFLPEPSSIEVEIYGGADYGDLARQCGRSDLVLGDPYLEVVGERRSVSYPIKNPSKSVLIEILDSKDNVPNIEFRSARFAHPTGRITLSMYDVKASYRGKEPEMIRNLREAAESFDMSMIIRANQKD